MFRLSFNQVHALLFIGLTLLTSAAPAGALPNSLTRASVIRRADSFTGPTSFQTVTTTDTAAGVVTQTCQVKLTPITQNGQNMVREEKSCTVTTRAVNAPAAPAPPAPAPPPPAPPSGNGNTGGNNGNNGGNNGNNGGNGGNQPPPAQSSAPPAQAPPPAQSSAAAPPPPPPSSPSPSPTPATPPPAASPSSSPTTTPSANASSASGAAASASGSSSTDSASPSGSAAASQTSDAPAFQVPGKKLEVLPIGLGVFAGISVIALIVVGLVTYERTKHRRVFRQRKMAEMGQAMGYSSTAGARV